MMVPDSWYIEWVDAAGMLRWGGFVEGFDAAWAKFIELGRACNDADWKGFGVFDEDPVGRVRVAAPESATDDQMASFDDAFGLGPEPLVGYDDAFARLRKKP